MRPTSGEARHRCARYLRLVGIGIDVRSWHKADESFGTRMSALRERTDMTRA